MISSLCNNNMKEVFTFYMIFRFLMGIPHLFIQDIMPPHNKQYPLPVPKSETFRSKLVIRCSPVEWMG